MRHGIEKGTNTEEALKYSEVFSALSFVLDMVEGQPEEHAVRSCFIGMMIAEQVGLSDDKSSELFHALLRKDAGCCKLAVSNAILDKPGKLTGAEFTRAKRHPGITHGVLKRVAPFRGIVEVAASHHEKWDGSGYHRGLSAENLSPQARILAVAEILDALSRDRQYRLAMPMEKALSILERERDVQVRSRTAA